MTPKRRSLSCEIEDRIRERLVAQKDNLAIDFELRLIEAGIKLLAVRAKLKEEEEGDGAFFDRMNEAGK